MCFWNTRCVNAWHIMAGRTRKCSRMNLELKYGKIFVNETFELWPARSHQPCSPKPPNVPAWCWSKAPCVWAIWCGWGSPAPLHMSLDFACILTMTVKLLEDQQAFYSSELGKARRNGQRQERGKAGKTGKGKHGKSKHCPCIFLGRKPGNAIDYRQLDFLPLQDHPLRHRPGVRTVVCEPGFPIA